MNCKQITAAALIAASLASFMLAGCASIGSADLSLGTPAEGRSYDRKIVVGPKTNFVNVNDGDVVKFLVHEQDGAERSFTWHFDVDHETVGDLSKLAPAGVLDRPVKVYVGTNARYSGG